MIESVLIRKNVGYGMRVTVKTLISAVVIALAVVLPQLVHLVAGPTGGMQWLPMYLPVLLGGCLLGFRWGLGVGILSPLVSFALTSMAGSAMPAAVRLPYMMAELAVFAGIAGLFSRKIAQKGWVAFPAVLAAEVAGRLFFLALVALFQSVSPLSVTVVWGQIVTGLAGLALQAVLVPLLILALRALLLRESK